MIKGTRFALLKNPWNLTRDEGKKLRDVQDNNARLFRAYLLHQTLASALDYVQPKRARRALDDWLSWACRSKLAPFVRVSRTIRAKKEGVLAYIQERLTNRDCRGHQQSSADDCSSSLRIPLSRRADLDAVSVLRGHCTASTSSSPPF